MQSETDNTALQRRRFLVRQWAETTDFGGRPLYADVVFEVPCVRVESRTLYTPRGYEGTVQGLLERLAEETFGPLESSLDGDGFAGLPDIDSSGQLFRG